MVSKLSFTLFLTICSLSIKAQDVIVLKNHQELATKLVSIGPNDVTYKKFDNIDGPQYQIAKKEILKIRLSNGTEEKLSKFENVEQIKNYITKSINEYGFDRDKDDVRLEAQIDGDILKITPLTDNKSQKRISIKNLVHKIKISYWDLSKISAVHKLSVRDNGVAFVNIVTVEKKDGKEEKEKLVIQMKDQNEGRNLTEAFSELDSFIESQKKQF